MSIQCSLSSFRVPHSSLRVCLRAVSRKPMADALGWDVANKAGLTEVFKPVIHEESIKVCPARSYGGAATHGRRVAGWTKVPVVNVAMKRFAA
jgi:hypothetical protein